MKKVAVSGGFDPIHVGHLRMMQNARALGDYLIVILNNDNWLRTKKGYVFMPEQERAEIIKTFPFVDEVVITTHSPDDPDRSVSRELDVIKPDIFANGGDRKDVSDIPEYEVCKNNNIEMVFNVGGGKVQSSSWLAKNVVPTTQRPWGSYMVLEEHGRHKVKRLVVDPGKNLSLQFHRHRSEHWIVISGVADVYIRDEHRLLFPNESTFVPAGVHHQIENHGKIPLEIIEVQTGDYVGEDDITRLSTAQ